MFPLMQELKDLVHVYKGRAHWTDGRLRRHEANVVSLEMQNASLSLQMQVRGMVYYVQQRFVKFVIFVVAVISQCHFLWG